MNPPVDAPASRQTRSPQSMPNASSAGDSLSPPLLAHGWSRPSRRIWRGGGDPLVRARGAAAVDLDQPRGDQRLGALAARRQPARDQLEVNAARLG